MKSKVAQPKPILMNHCHYNNLIYYLFQAYLLPIYSMHLHGHERFRFDINNYELLGIIWEHRKKIK